MKSKLMEQFGAKIWLERRHLGMTQAELAKKVGVSQVKISRLENGVGRYADLELMSKITKVLKVRAGCLALGMPRKNF